jgi:hypothetical protein
VAPGGPVATGGPGGLGRGAGYAVFCPGVLSAGEDLVFRIIRATPRENKSERLKISHCMTSSAVPLMTWTAIGGPDEASSDKLERIRVVAYATARAIADESQRAPRVAFDSRDLRRSRRIDLYESIGSLWALNVIFSIKNDKTPRVKRTPPAARKTGNPMCCRVRPYWTIASGAWRV